MHVVVLVLAGLFITACVVAIVLDSKDEAYMAANAAMDALVLQRRAMGLAGLSIQWGPWLEVGMAVVVLRT